MDRSGVSAAGFTVERISVQVRPPSSLRKAARPIKRDSRYPVTFECVVVTYSRSGIVPAERYALRALRTVNLAGSPASPECMSWFYENVKQDLWVANGSGGTDCCTGFVGGVTGAVVGAFR